jgi:hypothetical protein
VKTAISVILSAQNSVGSYSVAAMIWVKLDVVRRVKWIQTQNIIVLPRKLLIVYKYERGLKSCELWNVLLLNRRLWCLLVIYSSELHRIKILTF